MCRMSCNLGASNSWNPLGLSRPVMGLLLFCTVAYRAAFLRSKVSTGRGGAITWPCRSPDLTSLGFFFWVCIKHAVHRFFNTRHLPVTWLAGDRAAAAAFTFHANSCVDGTLIPCCRAVRGTFCSLFSIGDKTWRLVPKDVYFSFLCPVLDIHGFSRCILRYMLRLLVFSVPFVFFGQGLFACPVPCVPLAPPISYWFNLCNHRETKTFRDVSGFSRQKVNRPCLHAFTLLEWL